MDINSPIGQQIYRSIEQGHMVPTATGFRDEDTGWYYDLTTMDYFVRRKPQEGRIERIYIGMDRTIPVRALDANEYLRAGSTATYDELLCPPTLPMNVKKNVRPGTGSAERLLEKCRSKGWEVLEHDPGKWPYFEQPLPQGHSSNVLQRVADAQRQGWPVNRTRNIVSGHEYGTPRAADGSRAEPLPPPPYTEAVTNAADMQQVRQASWQQAEEEWNAAHPYQANALVGFGVAVVTGGVCLVGAAVGFVAHKIYNVIGH